MGYLRCPVGDHQRGAERIHLQRLYLIASLGLGVYPVHGQQLMTWPSTSLLTTNTPAAVSIPLSLAQAT